MLVFTSGGGSSSSAITLGTTTITGGTTGKFLYDAAGVVQEGNLFQGTNTIDMRNGANAQTMNFYESYTDASNYSRLRAGYGGSGGYEVFSEKAGTGTLRPLQIGVVGLNDINFYINGSVRWKVRNDSHLVTGADNVYDIGAAAATRPRTVYAGTSFRTVGYVRTEGKSVASLTAAATAGAGARDFVTDASMTMTLGIGTVVAGGGANKVPVYSDGTNWLIG